MVTNYETLQAEIERLTAEVSRLRDDRNCEKHMRKDAEERAHNAEAELDAAKVDIGRLTYERDEAIAVSRRAYNESSALTDRTRKAEAERDEARGERDTEQAFRQKANARADAALADARRLRDALADLFVYLDPDIVGMPGSALENARAALAATGSRS